MENQINVDIGKLKKTIDVDRGFFVWIWGNFFGKE